MLYLNQWAYCYFWRWGYFSESLGIIFYDRWALHGIQKINSRVSVSFNHKTLHDMCPFSWKPLWFSFMFLNGFNSIMSNFFSLMTIALFYWQSSVPSNRQDFLSTFADIIVYGAVNIHHKDYLTNNGGIERFSELCHNLIIISNYHNYL